MLLPFDHVCERLPLDELHRKEMNAALLADGVDRDDVLVVQAGGGAGFIVEALQLPWIERGSEGEHLEGDAAAERDLLRFIDDAHAAPADLAHQAKIAEALPGRR